MAPRKKLTVQERMFFNEIVANCRLGNTSKADFLATTFLEKRVREMARKGHVEFEHANTRGERYIIIKPLIENEV